MRDVFGQQVVKNVSSQINIASSNPYNAERWRLSVDGTTAFPQYDAVPQYNHDGKRHRLEPGAGETVRLRTAERPKYVVEFESAATMSWAANKDASGLTGDDRIRIGRFDGSDGWAMEFNAGHSEEECDLLVMRGGSVVRRKIDRYIPATLSDFIRILQKGAWYDATRHEWDISLVRRERQVNAEVGTVGMAGEGPTTPNLPIMYEVRADSLTSDLVLKAGSVSLAQYGRPSNIVRVKEHAFQSTLSTAGDFEPLYAIRKAPSYRDVEAQILRTEILKYGTDELFEVAVQAFRSSKVSFDGTGSWGVPPEWSSRNNILETRSDVDQIADQDGNLAVTPSNPGGYQLGYHTSLGDLGSDKGQPSESQTEKAFLHEDDVAIVLGRVVSSGSPSDATIYTKWSQGW
jgi:hypothetical protein